MRCHISERLSRGSLGRLAGQGGVAPEEGARYRYCCLPLTNPPPAPKHAGAGAALMRFNALRETRAGMHLQVHDPAFKSAKTPYLDSAGAGAVGAAEAA